MVQVMALIDALSVLVKSDSVVAAGRQIAAQANSQLLRDDLVQIDLRGTRGLSSSFFNILFKDICMAFGIGVFDQAKVVLHYSSAIQQETAIKSLDSVKKAMQAECQKNDDEDCQPI